MNYAKTIENLKLTKLTEKEQMEFSKKYDKQLVNVQIVEKTTEQIVKEDEAQAKEAKEAEEAKEVKDAEETKDAEESDDEGLSQVTIDSIKRAEEEFEKYQDLDDFDNDEKSPINIGDQVNKDELEVENLTSQTSQTSEPNNTSPKNVQINESKNEDILEVEELPVQDESKDKDESKELSLLKLSTTNSDIDTINADASLSNSIQKKTIKINQQ